MATEHTLRRRRLSIAAVLVATAAVGPAASSLASSPTGRNHGCERAFERAQRIDMESFRDYDAETFRDGHTEDAVTVFASGAVRYGIDNVMAALAPHFENREAIWSWTELERIVDGCRTAWILYDTVYEIPSVGFVQHALTAVTYTFEHGRWLAVADQGTLLPPPAPAG